jgi:hypothetical protein
MNLLLGRLQSNQQAGSKPRCHLLTHGDRHMVAERLTTLIEPFGVVSTTDQWMPRGFDDVAEAQLHNAPSLLPVEDHGQVLASWWLAHAKSTSVTPNWDIASTCSVAGNKGMLLVEAKAHLSELKADDRCGATEKNRQRIRDAIREANQLLNNIVAGWNLSHDNHYQLCNRFVWSWKLATLGIPIILVYLGFLNAREMGDPFATHEDWESALRNHAGVVVPERVWGHELSIDGISILPLIRSMELPLEFDKGGLK